MFSVILRKNFLFLVCRNANPVVLPGNDQPLGTFTRLYRNRTDFLSMPDSIIKEIVKDLVKDRVCENLNRIQIRVHG